MTDYETLRPNDATKDEGSFVRTLEGQTGTGLQKNTHVHKDWWAKTMSYEDGLEQLEQGVAWGVPQARDEEVEWGTADVKDAFGIRCIR